VSLASDRLAAGAPFIGGWLGRLLARTGAATVRRIHVLLMFAAFAATAFAAVLRRDAWRRPVRRAFMDTLDRVAVQSLTTTLVTGVLLGFALVTEVVYWLQTAGETRLVGAIVVRVLVREITPVVVGLIIFGRAGTGILIEIGEARPRGWLRRLERQGIDPVALIVMPRMLAYALGAFCLAVVLLVSTLLSGFLVASSLGVITVSIWQFAQNVTLAMEASDFIIPPAKCVVTGIMVALVCTATALARADENQELQRLVQQGFIRSALAILLVSAIFDLAV
jgi:phospholipid/cholesterol/gamma-HCH transport system permease protein